MILKVYLTLLLVSFYSVSKSQELVLFGGPQATSARYTVNNIKQPSEFKYGVMAGIGAKVPFDGPLFFFPSIYYSQKGYKVTLNNPSFPPTELAKNNNTILHTIEVAPLFQVDLSKQPSHFFIRFGPAVDFVFAGREKFDTVNVSSGSRATVSRNMVFSFGDYGRFTASGIFHLGYETPKGLILFAHYAHGIGNLNNADGGPKILNRIIGISAGWIFGRKK